MGWIILIVIFAIIAACLESLPGKLVAGSIVLAIGFLLLRWITGVELFITLAKTCAIILVVVIVGTLLLAIIN